MVKITITMEKTKQIVNDAIKEHVAKYHKIAHRTRFVIPTEKNIEEYCKEKNIYVDPKQFIFFYGSKGWVIGKSKMKDWRLAVCRAVNWECNQNKQPPPKANPKVEQVGLEQKRQEIRAEYAPIYRSMTVGTLKARLENPVDIVRHWLIKEIIAEKEQAK